MVWNKFFQVIQVFVSRPEGSLTGWPDFSARSLQPSAFRDGRSEAFVRRLGFSGFGLSGSGRRRLVCLRGPAQASFDSLQFPGFRRIGTESCKKQPCFDSETVTEVLVLINLFPGQIFFEKLIPS
jgi:hypothetical protein